MSLSEDQNLALAAFSLDQTEAFVIAAAEFLAIVDDPLKSAEERQAALGAASATLRPLVITARDEPRRTVMEALRAIERGGLKVAQAVCNVFRGSDASPPPRVLTTLIELLAGADIRRGEAAAFAALRTAPMEMTRGMLTRFQTALVDVAGIDGGPAAIFAMLDRLQAKGGLSARAGFEALRLVASIEPSKLQLAFDEVLRRLPEQPSAERFRPLIQDLVRRAGEIAVLKALTSLDPEAHPGLFEGAFGPGQDRAFEVVSIKEAQECDIDNDDDIEGDFSEVFIRVRQIRWGDRSFSLDDFLRPDEQAYWHRAILHVSGTMEAVVLKAESETGAVVYDLAEERGRRLRETPDGDDPLPDGEKTSRRFASLMVRAEGPRT